MNTKHTPGPWMILWRTIVAANMPQTEIATPNWNIIHGPSIDAYEANARLIAAAPELLEALQEASNTLALMCLIDKTNTAEKALAKVDSAIKKATE